MVTQRRSCIGVRAAVPLREFLCASVQGRSGKSKKEGSRGDARPGGKISAKVCDAVATSLLLFVAGVADAR